MLHTEHGLRGRRRSLLWCGREPSRRPCDRDYDPTTATFLTPDPLTQGPDSPQLTSGIGYEDGQTTVANPYHYVGNDPINHVDPLGLCRAHDGVFLPEYEIYGETAPACLGHNDKSCQGEGGDIYSPDDGHAVVISQLGTCYAEWDQGFCDVLVPVCSFGDPLLDLLAQQDPGLADYLSDAKDGLDGWIDANIASGLQACAVVYCWNWDEQGHLEGRWSLALSIGGSSGLKGDGSGTKGCVGIKAVGVCHSPGDEWWRWKPEFSPGIGLQLWARSPG